MELDDLKADWQKETTNYYQLKKKDMDELHLVLKNKTSDVLLSVKKKYEKIITMLFIGVFFNILISPFLHWILGDAGPIFRMPALLPLLTVIFICLAAIFFYWTKYISTKSEVSGHDLKTVLSANIMRLKQAYRQEVYFFISFLSFLFIAGRATSQYEGNGSFWDIFKPDILIALLAGCTFTGLALFFRGRQYKRNIGELEKYLSEFDEA